MWSRLRSGSLSRFELTCLGVVVAGAVVRVWGLGWRPLWFDEIFSWLASRGTWGALWAATAGDVHPPLYYAVLKVAMGLLGDAEWALRLPSALLSIVGLALTWPLARSYGFTEGESLTAVVFMAFAPFQIQYALEARMYALLQVWTMSLLLALNYRRWRWAALLTAASAWTHNYAILFAGAAYSLALAREIKLPTRSDDSTPTAAPGRIILSAAVAGALYAPWAWTLWQQMRYAKAEWWQQPTQFGAVLQAIYNLVFGQALFDWPMMLGALWVGVVVMGALHGRRDLGLKWLVLSVPAAALLIELVYRPIWLPRAMMVVAAPCYLLCARYLASSRSRQVLGALGLGPMLLGVLLAPHGSPWFEMTAQPMDYIRRAAQPGDVIYHADEGSYVLFSRYYPELEQYILPIPQRPLGGLSPATMRALHIPEGAPDGRRGWLVTFAGPMARDSEVAVVQRLVGNSAPVWRWETPMYSGTVFFLNAVQAVDPCYLAICLSVGPP